MYPADVLQGAGLVEVEDEARAQHIGGALADLDCPPGRIARRSKTTDISRGIRRQVHFEREGALVEVEVHCGEVEHGGLVDIDVEAVVGLHLQSCLQAGVGKALPRPAAGEVRIVVQAAHLGEAALGVVELLCVVVAGDPPRRVVARHAELRQLVGEPEGDQRRACRELIAETEAVVVEAEADDHRRRLVDALAFMVEVEVLHERYSHLVVTVADAGLLAPDGVPHFVEAAGVHPRNTETACQVALAPLQSEAHARLQHHGLAVALQLVVRHPVAEAEAGFKPAVGALQLPVRRLSEGGGECRQAYHNSQ